MPENENAERCVLFSPLGKSDPVANNHDGAFLHILRHYKPDKAVLFMTKEIYDTHCTDNRYCFFAEKASPGTALEIDAHPEIAAANRFDIYDALFRKAITKLHEEYPQHKLLVNITSGTPQMLASLYLLCATLPFEVTPIQVSTPFRRSNPLNKQGDRPEFAPEAALEALTEQNDAEAENRCNNISLQNVRAAMTMQNIKGRIEAYDYAGAAAIAKAEPALIDSKVKALLDAAQLRLALDTGAAKARLESAGIDPAQFFPTISEQLQPCYEYILALDIYLKRGAYTDYARAVSPAIMYMLLLLIKKRYHLDVQEQLCELSGGVYRMTREYIEYYDAELMEYLDVSFGLDGKSYNAPISSANLMAILEFFSRDDEYDEETDAELDEFRRLRDFESEVRNLAAHDITPITADQIKRLTGLTPQRVQQLMQRRFSVLCDAGDANGALTWDGYDKMNEAILAEA